METKFGQVFVLEREIAADGTEAVKQKLIESIFFSNFDYKWYDSEGKLSPLFKKYEGRSFSIQYNIKQQDKDGKEIEFQAKLNVPYKLGQLPHQDFENVPPVTKELIKRLESVKMLTGDVKSDDAYRVFRDLQAGTFVASFCPGQKISQMKVLLASIAPYFLLDEYIDKAASQKDMPFKLAQPYYTVLDDILEGNTVSSDVKNIPDSFIKVIVGLEEFRDAIAEKNQPAKYLIESYRQFHDGNLLENCREWKEKQSDKTSLMYTPTNQQLRLITVGAYCMVEMILYDRGIQIDEKIRESFLFKSILRSYARACNLINDLVSLKKEMAADETSNVAYMLHVRDGLPLEEAFQKIVDEFNLLTNIIDETGELLIHLYGEYAETQKLVDILKYIIGGNFQWSSICNRYHENLVMDCIVGVE